MISRVSVLFFISSYFSAQADTAVEDLTDALKQQVYNIYNNVALIDKDIKDINVTADNITYYLWTKHSANFTNITDNLTILNKRDVPFVILLHGWQQNITTEWYGLIIKSLLQRNSSFHIVAIDWSPYSNQDYIIASHTCGSVGAIVGKFLITIIQNYSIPLTNLLLIGHSLGGQVMGFAGKKVQQSLNQTLPRLVALDPAGPLFVGRSSDQKLQPSDGKVVQVVHTSGNLFGYGPSCGTLDMYPNGGSSQPGCLKLILTDITNISSNVLCDHHRSWQYYSQALIHPDKFGATRCATSPYDCDEVEVNMGSLETTETGEFYLATDGDSPYYKD